jgi:hypothetical protein
VSSFEVQIQICQPESDCFPDGLPEIPHCFMGWLMLFCDWGRRKDKLSALMALVFSPKKWLVSYKICVTTVDKNNKTVMPSSGRYSDSSTHILALFLSLHHGILKKLLWCLLNRRDDHCWFLQTNYTVVFLVREKWNVWRVTIGLLEIAITHGLYL